MKTTRTNISAKSYSYQNFRFGFAAMLVLMLIFTRHATVSGQSSGKNPTAPNVQFWLTSPSKQILFRQQDLNLNFGKLTNRNPVIGVNETSTFQTIDGFGFALTGGSAILLNRMEKTARTALLNELFATGGNNIGTSYLRISIGASDLSDRVFSYDDLPSGETDPDLTHFSINPELADLIPVLKEILAINPNIKILGSPWSAPTWMKTNNNSKGGSLKPEYFESYAHYFVKYIQEMAKEGIAIDAITIQNEPLHPGNNPSMYMTAADQALFVKNNLGPAFAAAKLKTKIIVYDHNADRPDYPISILNDADAAKYVDGSAFHLYGGKIDALGEVHRQFPDKNLYFTEQWVGAPGNLAKDLSWHVRTLIIGGTRNWCRTVIEWNLASDPGYNPHTDGGCTQCLGAVTINGNSVTRNPAYYIIAHVAKFVRPGSVRIDSGNSDDLPNVAFLTPEGKKVLIVFNNTDIVRAFNIQSNGKYVAATLDPDAAGTFVW